MQNALTVYNIHFDQESNIVVMEWNGYSTSQQFREGTELMLNILIQNKSSRVLADIRNMSIIGMQDQEWLKNDFIPRAIKFGFRAIAIVKPHAYFNRVAVESISYKVDKEKLTINFFDNPREAKEWLCV